jgi:hypothetical protein
VKLTTCPFFGTNEDTLFVSIPGGMWWGGWGNSKREGGGAGQNCRVYHIV